MTQLDIHGIYAGNLRPNAAQDKLSEAIHACGSTHTSAWVEPDGRAHGGCGAMDFEEVMDRHLPKLMEACRGVPMKLLKVDYDQNGMLRRGDWRAKVVSTHAVSLPEMPLRPKDVGDITLAILDHTRRRLNLASLNVEFVPDEEELSAGYLAVTAFTPPGGETQTEAEAECAHFRQYIWEALCSCGINIEGDESGVTATVVDVSKSKPHRPTREEYM